MNWLKKIKSWPIGKKRIFSASVAIFLTILILVFNYSMNALWKKDSKNNIGSSFDSMRNAFVQIFADVEPTFDKTINGTGSQKIIGQINQLVSSSSATSSIVK